MNCSEDKAASLSRYNGIKNTIETKYSPTLVYPVDTTTYAQTRYFGKNQVVAIISCFRYESVSNNIYIGTKLQYWTQKNKACN